MVYVSQKQYLLQTHLHLSITEVAISNKRPDKVIGMHFFNPAPVMKLVEVIKGMATSQETFDAIKACKLLQ